MGTWGTLILARGAIRQAESVTAYPGGWGTWQRHDGESAQDPSVVARQLAAETGAPALAGYVMDSDCVVLAGFSRSGAWQACLDPDAMAGYVESVGELFLEPDDAAAALVGWAADAGLEVAPAPVAELFRRRSDPFAEELFFELAELLLASHNMAS